MTASAERMKAMQVAALDRQSEDEALGWIEAASEFDALEAPGPDETR